MTEIIFKNLDELPSVVLEFIQKIAKKKHFAFYGEMGVGKTTFIKELCKSLGVLDKVTSPTFSIINEYYSEDNGNIYHFDFYRIRDIEEVYNLGYEDYFYSDHYCFIEWPELVEQLLPEHISKIYIKQIENGYRKIFF